eukprot:CAMPEP_0196718228 /NCGR_PEP_ID=MMETSP1091-20130531/1493_1 /TAXON_ID=302021 /ORGANISM="Rhodomonas sp., Strain CCMP768" /LENGTH=213 /DNA_ID=CAMNT_0042058841 /DNA_START=39 /DNA_END=680 /DNA_ORIENTATION=-
MMQDSTKSVYILLQQAVRVARHTETQVVVECAGRAHRTTPIIYSASPLWNVMFELRVDELPCAVKLSIMDSANGKQVGSSSFVLEKDSGAGFYDGWLSCEAEHSKEYVGKVRIGVSLDRNLLETLKQGLCPSTSQMNGMIGLRPRKFKVTAMEEGIAVIENGSDQADLTGSLSLGEGRNNASSVSEVQRKLSCDPKLRYDDFFNLHHAQVPIN